VSLPGGGVLKSTDGGMTWRLLANALFDQATLGAVAISPTDANTVFLADRDEGSDGGVWQTTDGGKNWRNLTSSYHGGAVSDVVLDPRNAAILYASFTNTTGVATNGIWKSSDGG